MFDSSMFDAVARGRQTRKVFADPSSPPEISDDFCVAVDEALEIAGWAPFHYPSHQQHHDELASPVPWRFHVLDHRACRTLIADLERLSARDDVEASVAAVMNGKIPSMLAAAGALVLVTWLPHPAKGDAANEKLAQMNEEHLLAAAAATQTLLLALTARSRRTYWSSGGALSSRTVFDHLGVGSTERFAAAVFVWPDEFPGEESVPGKHRETRGPLESFSRRI